MSAQWQRGDWWWALDSLQATVDDDVCVRTLCVGMGVNACGLFVERYHEVRHLLV